MKRLVICYDGTWNAVTNPDEVTNVVRMAQAIRSVAEDGTTQVVYYNAGVGSGGPIVAIERTLAQLQKLDRPFIVGPYLSGTSWEMLFWIPFARSIGNRMSAR